jgi:hypothetical protein
MADIASKIANGVTDKYTVDRTTQSFAMVAKGGFRKGHTPWNKGKPHMVGSKHPMWGKHVSEESRVKMRLAKLGRKLSEEHKIKISATLKGRVPKNLYSLDNSGANSHWWKGGITPENEHQRKTKEFKNWRTAVYKRDGYRCWKCRQNTRNLHPHHIFNFSDHLELRFEIDNGATLCEPHHREFHGRYGLYKNNDDQLREYLWQ